MPASGASSSRVSVRAERRSATAPPGRPAGGGEHPGRAVALEHPRVAQEQGGGGVGGCRPHVGHRPLLHDPALAHHHQPVGDGERLLVVVGDQERGGARRGEDVAQLTGQPFPHPGVERGERLVEQQQPRLGGQRAGQRDPLPLAARERAGQPVAVALEPHHPQQTGHPGVDVAGAPQPRCVAHVAGHGEVGEELALLEHQREPAAVGGHPGQVGAVPAHPARRRRLEPGHRPQQRRLAAAGRAEHGHHLAGGHGEVGVAQRRHAVEGDRDVVQPQAAAHQAPNAGTRSRSTASITSTVTAPSSTEAASDMP